MGDTDELRIEGPCHDCGGAGPVVIVQCDTDPGDMGEPRVVHADDETIVFVPSFSLWAGVSPSTGTPNENPTRADVWYTPDCGHLHLSDDGMAHATCPDGGSPSTGDDRPCARYFGSDGSLCSTHNDRFPAPNATRCYRAVLLNLSWSSSDAMRRAVSAVRAGRVDVVGDPVEEPVAGHIDVERLGRAIDAVEEGGVRDGVFDRLTTIDNGRLARSIAFEYDRAATPAPKPENPR